MKQQILSFLLILMPFVANAYTAEIDGIYYNFDSSTRTAEITYRSSISDENQYAYSGEVDIPGSVKYNGAWYNVTVIGEQAFASCSGITNVSIPPSVTSIGYLAFKNCTGLTTLIIPDGVTSIGMTAFYNCSGLTSVTMSNILTTIGMSAFWGCSSLTSVIIPQTVTSIGDHAFEGCSSLTSVTVENATPLSITENTFTNRTNATLHVPAGSRDTYVAASYWNEFKHIVEPSPIITFADANVKALCVANWDTDEDGELSEAEAAAVTDLGVVFKGNKDITSFNELKYFTGLTTIPSHAFDTCSSLTSVIIPNSVTSIIYQAFRKCSGLTSITIPSSVTSIGSNVFTGCSSLTSIKVSSDNTVYDSRNNCNAIIKTSTNSLLFGCQNTVIPNNVTEIYGYAFWSCTGLTSVTIPNSVTSIGNRAFYGCTGLISVSIPNKVTSIGVSTFEGCSGLTSVSIPNSVTSIGNSAFYECTHLASIEIPNSVTSIGFSAFSGCSRLNTVTLPSSITSIGERAFLNCYKLASVTVNCSPTTIGGSVFSGNYDLKEVTFDCKTVTSLFNGCTSLKTVNLSDNVESIGSSAFTECTGLTTVNIPNSVTSIGGSAFYGCTGLTSVTIPSNVTSIGSAAFNRCSGLTSVTVGMSAPVSIAENTFTNRTNATLHVPVGSRDAYVAANYWNEFKQIVATSPIITYADANVKVLCIANWDIDGDGELSEGEAADVTDLGEVFKDNQSITSFDELKYFTGLTSIGENAFSGCSGLKNLTIPNTVTSIGEGAFLDCSGLTSITIPRSVTNISVFAFGNCSGLKKVIISDIAAWCKIDFAYSAPFTNPLDYAHHLFVNELEINDLIIPNSVTKIGDFTFSGCSYIKSISIPNSVESIGDGAFRYCSSLTSVTIPNSVTTIGAEAFQYCTRLSSVSIPNSVTNIGTMAFENCNLTSIIIPNSVTSIGFSAFENCSSLTSVTVMMETPIAIYNGTFTNSTNATLYVPKGCKAAYEAADYWKEFKEIVEMEGGDDPGTLKCAKPTITFSNEQILFGCETEGVEFHYTISSSDAKSGIATQSVVLTHKYTISVYATKAGYENSETATTELAIKNGDMNGDGVITVTDTILLLDEVLTKP